MCTFLSYCDSHHGVTATIAKTMELVRASHYGYSHVVLEQLPPAKAGFVSALRGPGLGTKLRHDFLTSGDVTIRRSSL